MLMMFTLMALVYGLIFGSFLNVCIYRIPLNLSIAFPSSHCFSCSKPIAWYDNIPVFSYCALGGKCRQCKAGISYQYPVIEAVTGLLFMMFFRFYGYSPVGMIFLLFAMALLVLSVIDIHHQILPDVITLPGIILGLLLSYFFPRMHDMTGNWQGFLNSGLGILLGGGFLFLLGTIAEWILKKEAMGFGDVKLLAMIGAFCGPKGVLWTMFISSTLGSIFGIIQKIKKGDNVIPYGPFLALGAFSYLFFGKKIVNLYLDYLTFGL